MSFLTGFHLQMHVSFSLLGSSQDSQPSALHSDVLKLFLQSLGVALTDVQDVIFKLVFRLPMTQIPLASAN